MNWKKLFAMHILERGYDYYLENLVENIDISEDIIRADMIGSDDYEVEISINNGEVTDLYCSCPYALDGRNCKHMAAVLYEWSEGEEEEETSNEVNTDLFQPVYTINSYKKKVAAVEEFVSGATDAELEKLCTDSVELINYARNIVAKHVNIVQIMTYYSLGRWIVETQQMGEKRAKYGSKVIKTLSENLQKEFGKGFSEDTLKNARKFYLTYKERISETVFSLFAIEKSETVFSFFEKEPPFIVSWSHYLQLMRIENEAERSFYEIETAKTGWGVRTLQRQYNSSLYERLALSRDKEGVLRLASEGNVITKPEDIIKQPTVLEFLGMEEKAKYSETDLETALINKLQKFLLELGKGYLFEARQKRFTYDEDNFYVDLVFYNRLLRCYVLIDLKVDKLTHQDIGQMQMYVNYYDRYEKLEDENPTIGILLCKEKNDALVEITLPKDANIYASEYKLYLPDKKLLQQKLKEWIEEEEE